jgi:hypothetical protein
MRRVRGVLTVLALTALLAATAFGQEFSQNFESDAVGSAAGWNSGVRWFTPAGTAAVINTDAVSAPNSMSLTGTGADNLFTWRDYGGLSSDGVNDVTVSFDMKVVNYNLNIAVSPFAYNAAVWGGSASGFGWPVNTNIAGNTFNYVNELVANPIDMIVATTDLANHWIHWSGTLHPVSRKADVTVTVLDGPDAGLTGGVVGQDFQYGVASDYYGPAMNSLRGLVLFNAGGVAFPADAALEIDNLRVVVPEPASLALLVCGALGLARRRRGR